MLLVGAGCREAAGTAELDPRFHDDPQSELFGTIELGPVEEGVGAAVSPADLAAARSALEEAFFVWTGAPAFDTAGCRHPDAQPSVLGSFRIRSGSLLFEPRFPFVAGLLYTACFDPRALDRELPAFLQRFRAASSPAWLTFSPTLSHPGSVPRVTEVWPAGDSVPANLLRFYVHFSEPMSVRDVASHVFLVDERGEALEEPFVDIPNGLWDARSTRLTLIVHPGRTKRGIGPHELLGPVLRAGEPVRLMVDGALRSANGRAMGEDYERVFRVTAADRSVPDPQQWRVSAPSTAVDPVVIHFDEALDAAQLAHFATVLDAGGEPVAGSASGAADGRSWSFRSADGWGAGLYRIAARRSIEDLAGNTPDRLFDVDTRELTAGSLESSGEPSGSVASSSVEFRFRFMG